MKLSERLAKDFSELAAYPTRNYEMSQDYLKELIAEVQALEDEIEQLSNDRYKEQRRAEALQDKAAKYDELQKCISGQLERMEVIPANTIEKVSNWDMLERLPLGCFVHRDRVLKDWWFCYGPESDKDIYCGNTLAEALKEYWESKAS